MKKLFVSFLLLTSSLAFADSLQCKAHLTTDESEDIQATDRVKVDLPQGEAQIVRQVRSKDQKITYSYQIQVENGKIIGLGIYHGDKPPRSQAFTRYLIGQEQVMMNAGTAEDQSLLVVTCSILL